MTRPTQRQALRAAALIGWVALAGPAAALDALVEKQSFTLTNFATQGGAVIPEMTLGYETYGTLNEAKDNAILITHFFSGNSHAAGKYACLLYTSPSPRD